MSPLDYILAGTGTVSLGVIIYLVYEVISAMKGERAALAVAAINERAQRDAERQVFVLTENLTTVTRELMDCRKQLAATQDAANAASKENVDAVQREVTEHPDLAGDVVTRMLASSPTVVAGHAPADGHGDAKPAPVQPTAVAAADSVRGPA